MRSTFLILISGYAFLHMVVFWVWVRPLKSRWQKWLGAALLAGLIPLPMVAWRTSHAGYSIVSLLSGSVAYLLMAPLFWHACWWLFLQALNGILWLLPGFFPKRSLHPLRPCTFRITLLTLLLLTIAASLVETHWLHVQDITLRTRALPPGSPGLSIVQITDMHLDVYPWNRKSRPVIQKIKTLNPDIIVSTGDFLDTSLDRIAHQAAEWKAVQPPLGKFAILGNHEGYREIENAVRFHEAAGFELLRGQAVRPSDALILVGVDDPAVQHELKSRQTVDETNIDWPSDATGNEFALLLKHQPIVSAWALEHIHLQLSGHTHAGQIFPFHLLVRMVYPAFRGNYFIPPNFLLHVSRGTGYWGPPFRFLAPPEITRIHLLPVE